MNPCFTYNTYQDVRHNLCKYSIPVLIIIGLFSYWWILPPSHRIAVNNLFTMLSTYPWLMQNISVITIATLVAFVLTEIIQIHDKWYDLYVIKWRFRFATDFILPRLIHPFTSNINRRFHEVSENNLKIFQERLYYPYVGDRHTKIKKNNLVRFYEAITMYWITQLNEIFCLFLFMLMAVYRFLIAADPTYLASLLDHMFFLSILLALNRIWIHSAREKVRYATSEEIEDILANHLDDLEPRIRKICEEYGIPYTEKKNT